MLKGLKSQRRPVASGGGTCFSEYHYSVQRLLSNLPSRYQILSGSSPERHATTITRSTNAVSMLGQRLRCWPNIETALDLSVWRQTIRLGVLSGYRHVHTLHMLHLSVFLHISYHVESARYTIYSIQVVMVICVVYQSEFINIICYYRVGILVSLYVIICLEYGALPMSLPAVQFRSHLGAGFTEKYHVSPLSSQHAQSLDIVSMLCPWASHFTLRCFT